MSSINLKPNKPDTYDGKRDFLTVNAWLYQVEQYLSLIQLGSPDALISDHNQISFASSYLKGNAAVWWFNLINSNSSPTTWALFRESIVNEFVPADHARRARDKLRKIKQTGSVEKYLAEYRNIVLTINDMNDGEKMDRFVEGLKYSVKVEVLKSGCNSFEDCARIALNIDSAIWGAKRNSFYVASTPHRDGVVPMEIGNLNGAISSKAQREQRRKDLIKGACFKCHKEGCRPWKCNPTEINNVQTGSTEGVILSDSENE